ncbi:hypothetical protein [Cognatiluteimonas telluris]|uniref:hypothetical protein n=1 Tax=Cognatiluteimonas telluris TaxID=1104775 RepID=UPI00140AEBBB|nr:hypothetical protein [Lysobacter telluris]
MAIAALLIVAVAFALLSAFRSSATSGDAFSPGGAAMAVFGYTLVIGCVPVMVFGAPLYAWLLSIGKASWVAALAIGLVPGLVLFLVASDLALWSMACGVLVALATHAICGLGSNNSFKPKPLRGSA